EMDERINKLALRIEHPDPEIINDKEMSLETHKILIDSRNELDIYRRAITQEAALIRTSDLPLLTESLHRMMFKSRWPNHPNNVVDLHDANKNGANTACSFQLSDKISSMKWGRIIGPLGKLI